MGALKIDFTLYNDNLQLQSDYFRNLPTRDFLGFAILFIHKKKKGKEFSAFRSILEHFDDYQKYVEEDYNTKEIGREELNDFAKYLHVEKELKTSTVKSIITKMKYILNKAYMNGWAVDDSYADAKVREEDSTFIYLSEKEVARIYYYDGLTKKEEEIRDMFVIGCMTGQRYSDYSRIKNDNVVGDNIHILQQKTRVKAVVPMTDYVREIFNKYNGVLPGTRCIQYFNKAIKIICKKVGLTDLVVFEREEAGEINMVKIPKYEMIASHTARRTFITNMIKNNVPTSKTRKCTGHKSTACFDRYDRMTLVDNARSLAGNGYLS